jgi:hypothetical protein
MRVYALLCGTLLTVGSAAIAQLALQSARPDHAGIGLASAPALPNAIWRGGALTPVTVEARVAPPAVTGTEMDRLARRAPRRDRLQRAARAPGAGATAGAARAGSAAPATALPTIPGH